MDQVKIGKFIAEQRKEKKLTQTQLAEKLNITDRAISKWENGKAMPDSSIMLELSNLLGISVNELLEGEKIQQEKYRKVAEENLIKMKQNEENIQKKAHIVQTVFTTLCLLLSLSIMGIFIVHMEMNYVMPDTYDGALFEAIGPLCILLTFVFVATGGILTFQEKYDILRKEEKEMTDSQKVEKYCLVLCIILSSLTILLVISHFVYKIIADYEGEGIFFIAGKNAMLTVGMFWIYTIVMNFNRKYTVHKK